MFKQKPLLLGVTLSAILVLGIIIYAVAGVFFTHQFFPPTRTTSLQYHTPTPYPTTNSSLPWKTYHNKAAGFSLSYPANWVKEEPADNQPDLGRISLDAAEGSLSIDWTFEPSVADMNCPQGEKPGEEIVGMEPVQVNGETLMGCHVISKKGWNGQFWTIGQVFSPHQVLVIVVEVKDPVQKNKPLLFQVLSTLKVI